MHYLLTHLALTWPTEYTLGDDEDDVTVMRTCCFCSVGEVLHALLEGNRVCGVTSLGEEIYVLRWKTEEPGDRHGEVEVYDVVTYRLERRINVPDPGEFTDMASCEHHRCVYISDHVFMCVFRLDAKGAVARWPVTGGPRAISVNRAHNVLVTCIWSGSGDIKEFTSRGHLLREIVLPADVSIPWHAIQSASGQFIVCHGHSADPVHRVCVISSDGRRVVQSHGGQAGPGDGQYDVPRHLAVDSNESVFVVDVVNRQVTLLLPTLELVRRAVSPAQLRWWPYRLFLDARRRRLYVTENDFDDGNYTSGRVLVFTV